jgi:hypothetical protein
MWTITETDIEQAKGRLQLRRANIETRYAEETKALDAEFAAIATLERAATEFALRHGRKDASIASEAAAPTDSPGDGEVGGAREETGLAGVLPTEIERRDGGDTAGGLDILKPGSRWRMYRSTRPIDAETGPGIGSATE